MQTPKLKLKPNWAGKWDTFDDWVNHATRDVGPQACPVDTMGYAIRAVCVDAKGRRCQVGGDFHRARDEKTFPIYFFWDCA